MIVAGIAAQTEAIGSKIVCWPDDSDDERIRARERTERRNSQRPGRSPARWLERSRERGCESHHHVLLLATVSIGLEPSPNQPRTMQNLPPIPQQHRLPLVQELFVAGNSSTPRKNRTMFSIVVLQTYFLGRKIPKSSFQDLELVTPFGDGLEFCIKAF
jgi:hypothetical protein